MTQSVSKYRACFCTVSKDSFLATCPTRAEGGREDVHSAVVGLILRQVGVDHLQFVFGGDAHGMDVEERIRHKRKEISGGADGFGGGFLEVSLNLLLKEFSESVEVALRPGFLTILAGSKEILSGSRYCCRYWAFCSCPSGVTGRFLFNF